MQIRRQPQRKARIEIIPMIDVIFFLLVFFIISSLSMTKINSVRVALPKTSTSAESLKVNVVLTIKKTGEIFINKLPVSIEGIGQALASAMKDHEQDTLVVSADEGSNYGLVLHAMDQARQIGVRRFSLSTEANKK